MPKRRFAQIKNAPNYIWAKNLRRILATNSLSNRDLGQLVGVTGACVGNYLRGREPRARILQRIADRFGVSSADLLSADVSGPKLTPGATQLTPDAVMQIFAQMQHESEIHLTEQDYERGFCEVPLQYRAGRPPKGLPERARISGLDARVARVVLEQASKLREPTLVLLECLPSEIAYESFLDKLNPFFVDALVLAAFQLSFGQQQGEDLRAAFKVPTTEAVLRTALAQHKPS